MKYLLIGFITIISLLGATSQITGKTWIYNWQNYYPPTDTPCIPATFSVVQTPFVIIYNYNLSSVSAGCPANTSQYVNLNLTASSTANTWTDTSGQEIVYNPTTNNVKLSIPGSSYTFTYAENGKNPSTEFIFALISSVYGLASSSQSVCPPNAIAITPFPDPTTEGQIQISTFYPDNTPGCPVAGDTNLPLSLWNSQLNIYSWVDSVSTPKIQVTFNYTGPQDVVSVTLTLNNTLNFTYTYHSTGVTVQGKWVLDWQSNNTGLNFPPSYHLNLNSVNGVNYQTSEFVYNGTLQNSFVIPYFNLYEIYDTVLATAFQYFTFDQTTVLQAEDIPILYSQNGSLYSPEPFVQFWGYYSDLNVPQCCAPSYVNITVNPNNSDILNVIYLFSDSQVQACPSLQQQIVNNQIQSSLHIKTPNISQLVWTDSLGSQIYLTASPNPSSITGNFAGQCAFTMVKTTLPPAPTGTFIYDWMNYYPSDTHPCIPTNFTITGTQSPLAVVFNYDAATTGASCPQNQSQFTTLTGDTVSNVWTNSSGLQFTYYADDDVIQMILPDKSYTFLYSANGQGFLNEQDVMGIMTRSWTLASNNTSASCCLPDTLFMTPTQSGSLNPQVQLTSYFTSKNCSSTTSQSLFIKNSSEYVLDWADNQVNPTVQISLPLYYSGLTLALGSNCNASYTMNYTDSSLGTTWLLDWQSSNMASTFPATYTIMTTALSVPFVTSYTMSQYTLNGVYYEGYVAETPQYQFYDTSLKVNFTFQVSTDTLMSISPAVLYSNNGGILSANPFVNTWASPNPSTSAGCCTPTTIDIAANASGPNELTATYTLPSDYTTNSACQDFIDVDNGQIESSLTIKAPSDTQLTWTDKYGSVISFTLPSETNEITVNFANQCTFTMTPGSNPGPLSARWLSSKVGFFVMGLFMLIWTL